MWRDVLEERRRQIAAAASGWRWPDIESVHMTLRFLGTVDAAVDEVARRRWAQAVRGTGSFELRLSAPGVFPPRGRPRILWAGVDADAALSELAAALERAARDLGFEPELREFRPHLTIARARKGCRASVPDLGGEFCAPSFEATEVILFRSVLHPDGARYTALERYPLDPAAAGS